MITSRGRLAVELSKLKQFEQPDHLTEQYPTDSEVASEMLWTAYYNGDIEGKSIADLGCGTGILGIGAMLLGAKKVFFVDNDEKALHILRQNIETIDTGVSIPVIQNKDVHEFCEKTDTVIQNPPFGTRTKHADREFLLKAFEAAPVIYTFHKTTSKEFISQIAADHQFKVENYVEFEFPIKASQLFHHKRIHRIKVGCWVLRKADLQQYQKTPNS